MYLLRPALRVFFQCVKCFLFSSEFLNQENLIISTGKKAEATRKQAKEAAIKAKAALDFAKNIKVS